MTRSLQVVVLAGGEGKRMRSPVPKVLVDFLGKPLLGHVVDAARTLDPQRIVIIGGRHLPAMKKAFAGDERIVFARQSKPLGTAHAVKQALPHLPAKGSDVLILCGDTPLIQASSLKAFLRHHRRAKAGVSVASAVMGDPSGLGRIVRGARRSFEAIVEEKDANEEQRDIREINAGMYLCDLALLRRVLPKIRRNNAQGEYYLTDIVHLADRKVGVWTLPDAAEARGINRPEEYREAIGLMRQRIFDHLQEEGVIVVSPEHTFIEADVRVGSGTVIHPFCVLRAGVNIAPSCVVGPFAHLRMSTELQEGAGVGSFVEVKASTVGPGARVPHLSFVGDAAIGADANLGAGVVTANFDGQAKHRTVVGPGAFIGSGAVLVAPTEVGADAVVGAGAVLLAHQGVSPGETVVGVPARPLPKKRS